MSHYLDLTRNKELKIMVIILSIFLMICGIAVPYCVFGPYQKHVSNHHTGKEEETLMEAVVFSFGFMCIAFFPVGLITLLF